jgi:hypothetical protein
MTLPESSDDDLHVSPPPPGWDPADTGTGTLDDPFHSVQTAIRAAHGGRTVWLAEGQYIEEVKLDKVSGTETNRIRVQPYPGALASIDCLETRFLNPTTGGAWEKIDEGAPDEYRWTVPFPEADAQQVRHGAFLETPFLSPPRHTRLVTYDHAEDFRSLNELFPKDAATGDNNLWEKRPDPAHPGTMTWTHTGFRNWVYLGPGLWFDDDDRRLHLRLSLTHHHVDGWPGYTGPTDPAQVTLALSRDVCALLLTDCQWIEFTNLRVRFGGLDTIRLRDCTHVSFDHVNVMAGGKGVRLEGGTSEKNESIRFTNGVIDGGLPPWFFRNDRKDIYRFTPHLPGVEPQPEPVGDPPINNLGVGTSGALLSARFNAIDTEVGYCELRNGHDVYVFGLGMRFHHNWVHNINDDAVNFGAEEAGTDDAWVYRNVFTQCLTALSFGADHKSKHVRIFRNLFDLREPTLSIRPGTAGDDPLRRGHFFKLNGPGEGPIDLWHNTCVVLNPGAGVIDPDREDLPAVAFGHFGSLRSKPPPAAQWVTEPRRAYNNVFVAAYPEAGKVRPIAFLPPSDFDGRSDGNVYARVSASSEDRYVVTGEPMFDTLDDYRAFVPSQEVAGRQIEPPALVSFAADGEPSAGDDLRHRQDSPEAVVMPAEMKQFEREVGGVLAHFFGRARGCYWVGFDRMWVGVDGLKMFPDGGVADG